MSVTRLVIHNDKPTINSSSVITEEPIVYHQTTQSESLKFQTGHPLLTLYPINIASTPAVLDTVDIPSGKVSLALRTRHEIARRARIEETKKVDPGTSTTSDDPAKPAPVQQSTEPPRKKVSVPKQAANALNPAPSAKPATFADNAPTNPPTKPTTPVNATTNPPPKAPAVDPNPLPANSRTTLNPNPSAPPNNVAIGKTSLPPSPAVAPLTPIPEISREGAARDKPAPSGASAGVKPPIDTANITSQRELTPNNHTESAKIEPVPVPDAHSKSTSHLTSIAIGVACAASLVIFAMVVVIFKIRVSKKRARRQDKLGDDFFGSHDRLSFSDSADSRKSLFLVPRPIGNKFPLNTDSRQEKATNHAGIGAHSPPQSFADATRNHTPIPLTLQSHSNYAPPRPPRSPLRAQAIQKPGAFYHPRSNAGSEHYTPDTQSVYSTNTGRGNAKPPEFYGQPTHEYNYAMEYLENYYPDSYESSAYHSNADPLASGPGGHPRNGPAETIGMDFLQVDDRPYDHRYTVDRNGILNNYTPSLPPVPVPRESDYFYKKRVT
ncbi:hypothetical protein PTTG_05576 [Puccinia triticina 1-1 BBBD Race 1]|uniref:Uncharacterized protein n=1 Tax=Puccinia triticina (isolate 1-1 / race 1 (BBBD)) TaxID=630390 RepID=A0A180GMU0_PUCT1|nr:hypothetical protein PTTG_05576 [Puccinia triticina 1-1 BBBD Race 1]